MTGSKIETIASKRVDTFPPKLCRFCDLPNFSWFRMTDAHTETSSTGQKRPLYQKLPNLNGANAYMLYRGYRYIARQQAVIPVSQPKFNGVEPTTNERRAILVLDDMGRWEWCESGKQG